MDEERAPKYVQQIGEREDRARIYIEDYVNTFWKQEDLRESLCFGLLIGRMERHGGQPVYYLSGAVKMDGAGISGQAKLFPGSLQAAKKEKARYFGSLEICGWYYRKKPWDNVDFASLEQLHSTHFGREGQLFVLLSEESEAVFYYGTRGRLIPLKGYFIYYEKNTGMQNYLVEHAEKRRETGPEPAMEHFRTIMKAKEEKKGRRQLQRRLLLSFCALLAAAAFLGRGGFLSGVNTAAASVFHKVQKQISELAFSREWQKGEAEEDSVIVQEIPGKVSPTEAPAVPAVEGTSEPETGAEPSGTESDAQTEASGGQQEQAVSGEGASEPPSEAAKEPETYRVKKGDTLKAICRKLYGNEEKLPELISLNGITDPNLLKEGQVLKLP